MTTIRTFHPLDPLTESEISEASEAVRSSEHFRALGDDVRFVTIDLREPPKRDVLSLREAAERPVPRRADVVLLDRRGETTIEATVGLDQGSPAAVITWEPRRDAQAMAVVSELIEAEELVKNDAQFQAALAKRGVENFDQIQIDAWPAGNFGYPEEIGRRLARCVAFLKPTASDNEWAHPVDGLIALVDLNKLEILRIDDHGVVPIPSEPGNFDPESAAPMRDDIAPLEISQPEGPGFQVDGHVVSWQRWSLHVGFNSREGLVLSQISYEDQGRRRPILYRASLSEMIVPYGDPSPTHYFKNAIDAGENGVGLSASPLTLGCDCLGEIFYFDAAVADSDGRPIRIPNAICMHEEDYGVLWRHIEWRNGQGEVRRSRRLVISSFSAIGNYDYGFFWYLYQDGTIEYEIKLTGVLSTGAVAPDTDPTHGTLVAPGLNAMVHQHFFNVRLDLDIDGLSNAVEEVWTEADPLGPDNPHGNAFRAHRRRFKTELEAQRRTDASQARFWEIINPSVKHRLGKPVAYRLVPGENTVPFAADDAAVSKRAGFIRQHLWVTPQNDSERYAAGDYPNQHAGGDGLPAWTSADRGIDDEDIVVWYTFGHHHVPRPEDWPVMPVTAIGFMLKPIGFFERNPALDVPPPRPQGESCH